MTWFLVRLAISAGYVYKKKQKQDVYHHVTSSDLTLPMAKPHLG